jgi:serine phosphatase RsbU (regulator of sigma subunit)
MLLLQGEQGELLPRIARTRQGQATHIAASRTLIRQVISLRKGVLSVDTQGDERFRDVESLIGLGVRTLVCVPMLAYDQVYGVIQVDSSRGALPFDQSDVGLVFAMACQVATAVANARMHARLVAQELMQRDLQLARSIQRHFLPRGTPQLAGHCFAVEYTPALAVGGDYYDFLELPNGQTALAVGDVSGKGVSAALYVAKLGSELRYAAVGQTEPALILERVNDALARDDNEEAMFVTLVLVTLEAASGQLKIANAGHLTPLVRRASGTVERLDAPAQPPLGVREQAVFEQTSHRLEQRDVLVLYSDGVTEATSRSRALFGDERLSAAVGAADGTAGAVCAGIVSGVRAFLDGAPQNDDITVVTLGAC